MGARITKAEFLKRAEQRFGDQFDYSEIQWRSFKSPVKIRCRNHPVQVISITPEKHLQTLGGCRHCLRERRIASLERELNRKPVDRGLVNAPSPSSAETHALITEPEPCWNSRFLCDLHSVWAWSGLKFSGGGTSPRALSRSISVRRRPTLYSG